MASNSSETQPLLNTTSSTSEPVASTRPTEQAVRRSVTFNPTPTINTIDSSHAVRGPPQAFSTSPGGTAMLSALNSRLRRRNSHGSPVGQYPPPSKIGPQRTTKNAQKLKLLPNPEFGDEEPDEESGRDVYSQYTRIKDPTARRDAARLGKADRDRLPRVTAYSTAQKYKMDGLMHYLKGRGKSRGSQPKLFDECIYTPYNYGKGHISSRAQERLIETISQPVPLRERRHSDSAIEVEQREGERHEDLMDLTTGAGDTTINDGTQMDGNANLPEVLEHRLTEAPVPDTIDFDTEVHTPEVFLFDYGVVVLWGMTLKEEQKFLKEIAKFEMDKLAPDDVETECFNFYYTREYQARIYNDFITLRDKTNYMIKLAISHALAQSVKTSLFEELVDNTIQTCQEIPNTIALTGTINLDRKAINMQIGELFILRINIHLNGSVLDTPELFWVEPQLEPVYQAVRSYLEMDQRVSLLTERLDVIADLLAVLKDQLSHGHGEMLEWIVIVLIAAEIAVAVVNIIVDLYAGVD